MDARADLALTRSLTALPGWEWRPRVGVRQGERRSTVVEVYEGEWLDTAYVELRVAWGDYASMLAHPEYIALDFECATTGGHLLALLDGPVNAERLPVAGSHLWRVSDEQHTCEDTSLARACAGLARARGHWKKA
jgi:hypothetical protein